jgi:6-phosphogluconolactonase
MQIRFPDSAHAAEACAAHILSRLQEVLNQKDHATLAISGGSSPRPMFEIFAKTRFEWDRIELFWVDERGVPPGDSQSNFKMANDTWLLPGKFPQANIHRIEAELEPELAAERYAEVIRKKLGDTPHFDLIHQGMGPDGHTASLFPGQTLINDRQGNVAAVWVEKFKQWRITLLPAVLLGARHTVMLVTGADKADALKAVLEGDYEPLDYPSQIIAWSETHEGRDVAWFLDNAAAAHLASQPL